MKMQGSPGPPKRPNRNCVSPRGVYIPMSFAGQRRGDVAQLGERGLCKPEVAGSIPVVSTIFQLLPFRGPKGFDAGHREEL